MSESDYRVTISGVLGRADRSALVLPFVARQWPQARRDAFVAFWALCYEARSRGGVLPVVQEAEAFAEAVTALRGNPITGWEASAQLEDPPGRAEARRVMHAEPWARTLLDVLILRALPSAAPVEDAAAFERATWEALDGLKLETLSTLDQWPCAVIEALSPDPFERVATAIAYYPERLPAPDAAAEWLATLRARMEQEGPAIQVSILRSSPKVRGLAVRHALDVAAQLFPEATPGRLAGDPRAVEALDVALSAALAGLASKARKDAAAALGAALRGTGAQGRADAKDLDERPADADAWRDPRRVAARLALALWCDRVAVALDQRRPFFRVPTTTLGAFGSLRSEGATNISAPSAEQRETLTALRRDDRSFALPVIGAAPVAQGDYFYVIPPKGSPLLLPLNGQPRGSAAWRDVIKGGVLRAHVLSWDLWERQGCDPSGRFEWTPQVVARDIGRTSRSRGVDLGADFEKLATILIAGVDTGRGKIQALTPEPLIQRYTRDTGETLYRHAPMTVDVVRGGGSFLQVPRALVEADPRHLPLALGIAVIVREGVVLAAKSDGTIRMPLRTFLERAGEDTAMGARRNGRAYWARSAERIATLAREGDLARIDVEGEGPAASVILAPSSTLIDAYRSLTAKALPPSSASKRLPGTRRGRGKR